MYFLLGIYKMTEQELYLSRFTYKDDGTLLSKLTNKIVGRPNTEGYIRIRISNKELRAHRVIWIMFNGSIPEGILIDHIDGDKQNNRIENLRLANRTQNNVNSIGKSKRGHPKGVQPVGRKFRAKIYSKGITYCLGTFSTIEEAKEAYDTKAVELHGEFAKLT